MDRPFPKVSSDSLLKTIRDNYACGDILCGDAAEEIVRLRRQVADLVNLCHMVGLGLNLGLGPYMYSYITKQVDIIQSSNDQNLP